MKKCFFRVFILVLFCLLSIILTGCNKKNDIIDIKLFKDGLVPVSINNKWGYVNKKDKKVIDLIYDRASPFNNGYAIVTLDTIDYLIDTKGNKIGSKGYNGLRYDKEANLYVFNRNEKCGLLNSKGKVIIEEKYDYISDFSEGLAVFLHDEKFGFINTKGKVVVKNVYQNAYKFVDGFAAVKNANDKWGYIGKRGGVKIDFIYDSASSFSGGIAMVTVSDKIKIINAEAKTVYENTEDREIGKLKNGYFTVSCNGLEYLYNSRGKIVLKDYQSIEINGIIAGYIVAENRVNGYSEYTLYDVEANKLFNTSKIAKNYYYESIELDYYNFDLYISLRNKNGDFKYYYWNGKKLKEISIKNKYNVYLIIDGNIIVRNISGDFGVIDKKGKIVLDFKYIHIQNITFDGYIIYNIVDDEVIKYGVKNLKGKNILEAKYDKIVPYNYQSKNFY